MVPADVAFYDEEGWNENYSSGEEDLDGGVNAAEDDDEASTAPPARLGAEDFLDGPEGSPLAEVSDLDALCEDLVCVPADEAEQQIRALLRDAGEVSEADVLAGLLKVFKASRELTLDEGEGVGGTTPQDWEPLLDYCTRLTNLCDIHFLACEEESEESRQKLPAFVVATVYADAGRTFALAAQLGMARDKLEKALYVYSLVSPGPGSNISNMNMNERLAAACASLARVLRRMDQRSAARARYIEAAKRYVPLQRVHHDEGLVGEIIEFIGEANELASGASETEQDARALIAAATLAEAQFGCGSVEHFDALGTTADLCMEHGLNELARPALQVRAELLKAGGAAMPPAQVATAFEALAAVHLSGGRLVEAADAWEEALQAHERLEGPASEVCEEMRVSLSALRVAAAQSMSEPAPKTASDGVASGEGAVEEVVPDSWEER
eukprot:NODE_5821_length_1731_cov_11.026185.p1 GENE.NODE_5821_length_1731_cov_11.026185~~NODE_5821_length_1731_cov_11.026185.p1  ORF type:complete len:441 (+),score=116.79 NODE_5821_length_1731_cov_11.026185:252-1574(+)